MIVHATVTAVTRKAIWFTVIEYGRKNIPVRIVVLVFKLLVFIVSSSAGNIGLFK